MVRAAVGRWAGLLQSKVVDDGTSAGSTGGGGSRAAARGSGAEGDLSALILGDGGGVSGVLERESGSGYESRPEQLAMARAVESALRDKSRLVVEAGTGVGKSFAYLVPAMLRCMLKKEKVVVATNTISLQEQLIQKDIPLLMRALDAWLVAGGGALGVKKGDVPAVKPVLVKGRGNYLSIRRLQLASQRQSSLFADAGSLRSLHVIEDWATTTKDGTLATLPPLESAEAWDHARSDADNCMGRACEHYQACFFQRARREMEQANLLVCNHALYFADLALRARHDDAAILPEYQHVILDEAHNIEDVACEHFGVSLTQPRVTRLLRTLYNPRRGKGYLTDRGLALADADAASRATQLVADAESASREFFDALLDAWERDRTRTGRVRGAGVAPNVLTPAMRALSLHLKTMREAVASEPDKFELNSYAKRAGDIAAAAEALIDQTVPDAVYWIEVSGSGRGGSGGSGGGGRGRGPMAFPRVTLACSPIEAGPILRRHLFSREMGIVLTSATLSTRAARRDEPLERAETAFAYTMNQLGCEGALTMQLGSPFDYANQVRVFVDTTMPSPKMQAGGGGVGARTGGVGDGRGQRYVALEGDSEPAEPMDPRRAFIEELSSRIEQHVRATEGGAFVLFTSFADLYECADALTRAMERLDMPLLVQNRGGTRSQLLEMFRGNERSVLLGAASFWQGVDVRGQGLRNVIITRLPFEPPDRPITQARLEKIEARGGNAFMEESLPRAVIRFKQGFGRLIRSKGDSGRVVVLDPRILTARYGKRFLEALPSGVSIQTIN